MVNFDSASPYMPISKTPGIDTRDPFLTSEMAPHESAGVLRMLRAGMSGPRISKELGISKQQLVHLMNLALDDEAEAERLGVKIYDSSIPKGSV